MTGVDPSRCPLCGRDNVCGMVAGQTSCWCGSVSIPKERLDAVPEVARGIACLCEACATGKNVAADNRVVRLGPGPKSD